jgi:hypothetical protein
MRIVAIAIEIAGLIAAPLVAHHNTCQLPGVPSRITYFETDHSSAVIKTAAGPIIVIERPDLIVRSLPPHQAIALTSRWWVLEGAARDFSSGDTLYVLAHDAAVNTFAEPAQFISIANGDFCNSKQVQTIAVRNDVQRP